MLDMREIYERNSMEDGKQKCFVANKFHIKMDASAIKCTARRIYLQEYLLQNGKI
jgi:hypothetical protein